MLDVTNDRRWRDYERAQLEGDAFRDFCDEHGYDHKSVEAERAWEDYNEYMSDRYDEMRAEERMDCEPPDYDEPLYAEPPDDYEPYRGY